MGIYRKTLNKISDVLNNLNYNDTNLYDYFDNLYEIVKFDGCALFYLSLDKISLVDFKNYTKKKILFDIIQRDIPFDNELYLILNNGVKFILERFRGYKFPLRNYVLFSYG